jgi:hypothetical protein
MPALIKPSPIQLRKILESDGWNVYQEDEYTWSMVKAGVESSLEIPKRGRVVTFEVFEHALEIAELPPGKYLELRALVDLFLDGPHMIQ